MNELPVELNAAFRPRPFDANKRSVGVVTVVGGSGHYIHAPVLAGLGARTGGAGLVQLVVPDASRICAGRLVPEATFTKLAATCVPLKADVTVVGMGLGTSVSAEVLVTRLLSGSKGRFVLDADALAILASWYGKAGGYRPASGQELVLTPHEGEAARLLGCPAEQVKNDRRAAAKAIAGRYGATVVLKGPRTLVVSADGSRLYENRTGNPFMALGGMGDLLAGVLGARWAYVKTDPFLPAAAAVWLHGAAADAIVSDGRDCSVVAVGERLGGMRVLLDGFEQGV